MRLLNITATAHPQGNQINLNFLNPYPMQYPRVRIQRSTHSHPTDFTNETQLVEEIEFVALLTWQPTEDCILQLEQAELCEDLRTQLAEQEIFLPESPTLIPLTSELPWRCWQLTADYQDYLLYYDIIIDNLQIYEYKEIIVEDRFLHSETVYYYTLFTAPDWYFDTEQQISAIATESYQFSEQLYQLLPHLYQRYDATFASKPLQRWLDLPGSQMDQLYSLAMALLKLYDRDQVEGSLLPLLAQWIGWQLDRNQSIAVWRNEIRYAPALYQTIGIIPTIEAAVKRILGWESRIKEYHYNILRTNCPERFNLWEVVDGQHKLLSLDFAYEGRPAVATTTTATWLFYHTWRHQQWEISYKTLRNAQWTSSQPLTAHSPFINKRPSVVNWHEQLWVFWQAYDEVQHQWQIHYCHQQSSQLWSPIYQFNTDGVNTITRQQPTAVVDTANNLWLFWLESSASLNRQLRYAHFPNHLDILGSTSGTKTDITGIQDLFVLFHPAVQKFWIFGLKQYITPTITLDETQPSLPCRAITESTNNQTHWRIVQHTFDPTANQWKTLLELPRPDPSNAPAAYDDREPSASIDSEQKITLVWSSNQGSDHSGGSWSIWQQQFDPQTETWLGSAEALTRDPYSQRAPLLIPSEVKRIIYRSNQSLIYQGHRYSATQTTDFRYAGCVTVDTCNQTKIGLRDQFDDFQSYTFDTGRNLQGSYENNQYSRGKIGIFLTPSSQNFNVNPNVLKNSLAAFLPLPVQPLLFINSDQYNEWFYTYQAPQEIPPKIIIEQWFDNIDTLLTTEHYSGFMDNYQDTIPQWICFYTAWTAAGTNPWTEEHKTVHFDAPLTHFRSWHTALTWR